METCLHSLSVHTHMNYVLCLCSCYSRGPAPINLYVYSSRAWLAYLSRRGEAKCEFIFTVHNVMCARGPMHEQSLIRPCLLLFLYYTNLHLCVCVCVLLQHILGQSGSGGMLCVTPNISSLRDKAKGEKEGASFVFVVRYTHIDERAMCILRSYVGHLLHTRCLLLLLRYWNVQGGDGGWGPCWLLYGK